MTAKKEFKLGEVRQWTKFFRSKRPVIKKARFTDYLVHVCAFMPKAKSVIVGCEDGKVHLLNIEQNSKIKSIDVGLAFHVVFGKKEYLNMKKIAISNNGSRMALIRESSRFVEVWDISSGIKVFSTDLSAINELPLHGFTQAVAMSSDGNRVAVACSIGRSDVFRKHPANYIFDVETRTVSCFQGHQLSIVEHPLDNRINDIGFSPDDRFLISAGDDGRVVVWSLDSSNNSYGGPQRLMENQADCFWRVCFSHSGKTFATGVAQYWPADEAPSVHKLLVEQNNKFEALMIDHAWVDFLAFTPDDSKLVLACKESSQSKNEITHEVWVWSEDGSIKHIKHDFGRVLAISPNASRIASVKGNSLIIWELATLPN